jgi:uncharacterized protein YceK
LTRPGKSTTIPGIVLKPFKKLFVALPLLAVVLLLLGGCASQTSLTTSALDPDHPAFRSTECREARRNAWIHQDLKVARLVASPAVVWWGGPITAIPVLATNVGLSYADKQDASDIAARCGGQPSGQLEIAAGTAAETALGVAASGAGSLVTKAVPSK